MALAAIRSLLSSYPACFVNIGGMLATAPG